MKRETDSKTVEAGEAATEEESSGGLPKKNLKAFDDLSKYCQPRLNNLRREMSFMKERHKKLKDAFNEMNQGGYITVRRILKRQEVAGTWRQDIEDWVGWLVNICIGCDERLQSERDKDLLLGGSVEFQGQVVLPETFTIKRFDAQGYKQKTDEVYNAISLSRKHFDLIIEEVRSKTAEFIVAVRPCGTIIDVAEYMRNKVMKDLLNIQNALDEHEVKVLQFKEYSDGMAQTIVEAYKRYTKSGEYDEEDVHWLDERINTASNATSVYRNMEAYLNSASDAVDVAQLDVYSMKEICDYCR